MSLSRERVTLYVIEHDGKKRRYHSLSSACRGLASRMIYDCKDPYCSNDDKCDYHEKLSNVDISRIDMAIDYLAHRIHCKYLKDNNKPFKRKIFKSYLLNKVDHAEPF